MNGNVPRSVTFSEECYITVELPQTDPTENWIHLKTEHLVLFRNFPYIFK